MPIHPTTRPMPAGAMHRWAVHAVGV